MGSSTTFYVGPFIKFNKGISVTETTEKRSCPTCSKPRDGNFCDICGTEVVTTILTKTKVLKQAYQIIDHIGYEQDEFFPFAYGDAVLVANYNSKYAHHLDSDDCDTTIMFDKLLADQEKAMAETRAKATDLIALLEQHNVDYSFCYGITIGSY